STSETGALVISTLRNLNSSGSVSWGLPFGGQPTGQCSLTARLSAIRKRTSIPDFSGVSTSPSGRSTAASAVPADRPCSSSTTGSSTPTPFWLTTSLMNLTDRPSAIVLATSRGCWPAVANFTG